jgi:hypothetical protein
MPLVFEFVTRRCARRKRSGLTPGAVARASMIRTHHYAPELPSVTKVHRHRTAPANRSRGKTS